MSINIVVDLLGSSETVCWRAGYSYPSCIYSGVMVCELKPSILATGFRFVLAWLGLGAP
jgi:hypothetical protein